MNDSECSSLELTSGFDPLLPGTGYTVKGYVKFDGPHLTGRITFVSIGSTHVQIVCTIIILKKSIHIYRVTKIHSQYCITNKSPTASIANSKLM